MNIGWPWPPPHGRCTLLDTKGFFPVVIGDLQQMKVQVHKIPEEGMPIQFSVTPDFLRQQLQAGDELAPYLGQPAACQGQLRLAGPGEVQLALKVRSAIRPRCYRCNAEYELPLDFAVEMVYLPAGSTPKEKQGLEYEDLNTGFYQEDEIDLGEVVREQLFLALPMRFLCRDDCRGLCGRCGANLNQGTCACAPPSSLANPFARLKEKMKP